MSFPMFPTICGRFTGVSNGGGAHLSFRRESAAFASNSRSFIYEQPYTIDRQNGILARLPAQTPSVIARARALRLLGALEGVGRLRVELVGLSFGYPLWVSVGQYLVVAVGIGPRGAAPESRTSRVARSRRPPFDGCACKRFPENFA
jgi:hypothetical protein